MKKTIILLIITSIALTSIRAQKDADIKQIRKWYNATKENIKLSKKNRDDAVLYCDILKENVYGASFPVVGTFSLKSEFWYKPYSGDNVRTCLDMVITKSTRSVVEAYSEYLFHNGHLVFVYYKSNLTELRYYFKNNNLIKQLGKCNDDHFCPSANDVRMKAEDYVSRYENCFND